MRRSNNLITSFFQTSRLPQNWFPSTRSSLLALRRLCNPKSRGAPSVPGAIGDFERDPRDCGRRGSLPCGKDVTSVE